MNFQEIFNFSHNLMKVTYYLIQFFKMITLIQKQPKIIPKAFGILKMHLIRMKTIQSMMNLINLYSKINMKLKFIKKVSFCQK